MRALITGGRGFVGRWLAQHLEDQGDEVLLVDKETDVADPGAFSPVLGAFRPQALYHLAALTHVGESWEAPLEVLRVNVLGTASVLGAAREHRCERALVVSSSEVYGSVPEDRLPVDEGEPLAPLSPYAASKAAAEQVALQAFRGYGQQVVVARPFNHIGPGQPPNFAVAALARRIVAASAEGRRELAVGNLSARRDFTDVRDVVRAYRLLVLHGEAGQAYNVCSGRSVAIKDVLDELLRASGASLTPVTDPDLVRPAEIPVMRGSAAKLAARTGWKPDLALEDTLRDVLRFFSETTAD